MKHLKAYIECGDVATPANTMGMGNPGEVSQDTLTEPIAIAKSEVEKDKKKKKKKIKPLIESLFDTDLAEQDMYIGDVYELDEWVIPERGEEYSFTNDVLNYGIKIACGTPLGKLKWKKILKPLSKFPPVTNNQCLGSYFLKYITELILCCKSVDQIPSVVEDYIMECRNKPDNFKTSKMIPKMKQFAEDHLFEKVQVQSLAGLNNEMLRMVVIKFFTKKTDCVICVTFKKRDL